MEAPERGALMLVRVIAVALIGWAIIEVALYIAICQHNNAPVKVLPCLIKGWPFLVSLIMLIKAKTIAHWVTEKLDL